MDPESTPVVDTTVVTPTPDVPKPWPSDNEILPSNQKDEETPAAETPERAEEVEAEAKAPEAESKPVDTGVAKTEEKESEEAEEESEFQEPEPEELKRAFKTHPELRAAYYRDKAFKDVIGTVKEAREYKAIAPTIDDLKTLVDHGQALVNLDQLYVQNPVELMARLRQGNPQAFDSVIAQARQTFHALSPDAYRQEIAEPIVKDFYANVKSIAEDNADEDLQVALDILSERLGWNQKQAKREAAAPVDPRILKLEAMEKQQADYARSTVYGFANRADQAVNSEIRKEVDSAFSKLPTDGIMPGVKEVVTQQILADVDQALQSNQYLTRIYNAHKFNGDISEEHLKQIVSSRIRQAKPHIAPRVATMMKKMTATAVETSKREIEKGVKASQRKEAGSGSGQGISDGASGKIDYSRTSPDDIMAGRITYKR